MLDSTQRFREQERREKRRGAGTKHSETLKYKKKGLKNNRRARKVFSTLFQPRPLFRLFPDLFSPFPPAAAAGFILWIGDVFGELFGEEEKGEFRGGKRSEKTERKLKVKKDSSLPSSLSPRGEREK